MTFFLSILFTILGILLVSPLLRLMGTPEDVLPESVTYLRIYFAGVTGLMFYNMGAGILRAVGDSKRPLYFLIFSAVLNVILDLLFVIVFHMGVAGVAYATVISQCLSAVLVLLTLTMEKDSYRIVWRELRLNKPMLVRIFKIGLPSALQMGITSFSNVFVQSYINGFGSASMAGWSSYGKIDKFCILPIQSISLAVTTFVGQNLGANQVERAKKGSSIALFLSVAVSLIMIVPIEIFAPDLVMLFNQDPEVVRYGTLFLKLLIPFYVFCCANQVYAGTLRGAGDTRAPMLIMMGSFIVFRQIYLFIISRLTESVAAVALGYPLGWMVCSLIIYLYYRFSKWEQHQIGVV